MENEELILKKTINTLQISGKKQKAYCLIRTLLLLNKQKKQKPLNFLYLFVDEISPVLNATKTKRGSKMIDLPKVISLEQQYKQGIRWFFYPLKKKKGKLTANFLKSIIDFKNKKGSVFIKRKLLYESMISSRPFLFILKYKQNI